jgi:parallel beta-helix repeat protein
MRRALVISQAIVVTLAVAASSAAAADVVVDPARQKLIRRIDAAVSAAAREPRQGIVSVRLAGVPAVLVTRDATLADVHAAVAGAVRRPRPGLWELDRLLVITRGATLSVAVPQVRELRLLSDGSRFATIVGRHASLRFAGRTGSNLVVHSWDVTTGAPDANLQDGRPSVSIRGAGRLDAWDTSFEDLGFSEGRVSGVAITAPRAAPRVPLAVEPRRSRAAVMSPLGALQPVTLPAQPAATASSALIASATDPPVASRPTGTLVRSRFVRNMFGAYSYEARDMRWIENEFLDNMLYGLDPHDNSDRFLVQGNLAARNGRHGIIFSRFCDDNVIRRNRSFDNGWHGIVIDDGNHADGPSNGNVIAENEVRDNAKVGISIDGSSSNLIVGNRIDHQLYGVRLIRRSHDNVVRSNTITRTAADGVVIDGAGGTRVRANVVTSANTGARMRDAPDSVVSGNALLGMRSHGVEVNRGGGLRDPGIVVTHNQISGSGTSSIVSDIGPDELLARDNRERWNYPLIHDVARALSWFVGPGLWLVLLLAVVLGPLPGRIGRARA